MSSVCKAILCWGALVLAPALTSAEPPLTAPDQVFMGQTIVFHTHSSYFYDAVSASRLGVQNLDRILDEQFIRLRDTGAEAPARILIIENPKSDASYFIKKSDVSNVVYSPGGAHDLRFSEAGTFVFSGGLLQACLCRTIRYALAGAEAFPRDFQRRPLDLILISDAIYGYFNRDGDDPLPVQAMGTADTSLAHAVAHGGDAWVLRYLSKTVFSAGHTPDANGNNGTCSGSRIKLRMENHTFVVFRKDVEIGRIGAGANVVRTILMTSQEYETYLSGTSLRMGRSK